MAAKETEVGGGWKAIIIFVPHSAIEIFPENPGVAGGTSWRSSEGSTSIFIAQRRILSNPTQKVVQNKQSIPGATPDCHA